MLQQKPSKNLPRVLCREAPELVPARVAFVVSPLGACSFEREQTQEKAGEGEEERTKERKQERKKETNKERKKKEKKGGGGGGEKDAWIVQMKSSKNTAPE